MVGLALVLGLAGCADPVALQRDHAELTRLLEQARAQNAASCAPGSMAVAEAEETFARLEFRQGDSSRAAQHLDASLEAARIAVSESESCDEPDADGDGIPDSSDRCPTLAEDVDGVADDDGCPELDEPTGTSSSVSFTITEDDQDGDGVDDEIDECLDDQEDIDGFEDGDGCPEYDNDQDDINDFNDGCPNAPEDFDGFQDDDGCPDLDNDGDGVADTDDLCPDDPGQLNGCPTMDSDGDGVADSFDRCPDEAETVNDYGDEDGCPDVKPTGVTVSETNVVLDEKIRFEAGEAKILPGSNALLEAVVQVLEDHPDMKLSVECHTDAMEDADLASGLSKDRAEAVAFFLTIRGIQPSRVTHDGFGGSRPIDTNRTESGRENNRRCELVRK